MPIRLRLSAGLIFVSILLAGVVLQTGCCTGLYRDQVIRGDTPGHTFLEHMDRRNNTEGVYLGITNSVDVTYHRYQIVDKYWRDGNSVLELWVPDKPHGVSAKITKVSTPLRIGRIAYFSVGTSENYRLNPDEILISKGLMQRPPPRENYDEAKQSHIPTNYPCMVCLRLSEKGDRTFVRVGRQLTRTEWPKVRRSLSGWDYPCQYQWVGTEAVRRNLDQIKWWCEWTTDIPVEGDVFPIGLKVRRVLLSSGYVITMAWDVVTLPVMFPFYRHARTLNWHE